MLAKDIGELELIETLSQTLDLEGTPSFDHTGGLRHRLRLSIGDDAAAWDGPAGALVLTTDAMVEGVHFIPGAISWSDLGWKSLAVNLSDVAAMGCRPLSAVVAMGLSGEQPVDGLVEMYRGMMDVCREHGGTVAGGDIVRSPTFFLAVTVVGVAADDGETPGEVRPLLTRQSASVGDMVAVTGNLGCSAGGLQITRGGLDLDAETDAHLRNAHNRPTPRVAEGLLLVRHGVATAIDISDGLIDDLEKLCKASGVGARVHTDRVPVDEYLRRAFADEWLALALSGGEDYELLFTAPLSTIQQIASNLDLPVTVIGEIVDATHGVTVLDETGTPASIERAGWDHLLGHSS